MTTTVVNIHRDKCDVYIGRGKGGMVAVQPGRRGYFGNPYVVGRVADPILSFRSYFLNRIQADAEFAESVRALRGKILGCFCKPGQCHGDVIAEWVDQHAPV